MSTKQQRIEVIKRAGKLLSSRKRWCRGTEAMNKLMNGRTYADAESRDIVEPSNPDAQSFCAIGALKRAAYEMEKSDLDESGLVREVLTMVNEMSWRKYGSSISATNDHGRDGRRRVLETFCDAIKKLEIQKLEEEDMK